MTRQIVLDTETTGLKPEQGHRIIEIGCLELVNRRITGNNLHFYLNPERAIDGDAIEVHGLANEFLIDKPLFKDIADELFNYLKNAELIIHNAPFDVGFLNHEFSLLEKDFLPINEICNVFDTLPFARRKHPGQQNSLDALCRRYHVDHSNRQWHGALLDAELLAQVYLHMTGGQDQLFAQDIATQITRRRKKRQEINYRALNLPVITPTDEELSLHEKFIREMNNGH